MIDDARAWVKEIAESGGAWVIASDSRASWLGRFDPKLGIAEVGMALHLSPAFDYLAATSFTAQGIQRMVKCAPLEMLPSAYELEILPTSLVWLAELEARDRKLLAGLVEEAETLRSAIRARQSGLEIVR